MQRAFKSWNFVLTLAGACRTCSPNDGRKASLVRMSLEVDARTQSSQLPLKHLCIPADQELLVNDPTSHGQERQGLKLECL